MDEEKYEAIHSRYYEGEQEESYQRFINLCKEHLAKKAREEEGN